MTFFRLFADQIFISLFGKPCVDTISSKFFVYCKLQTYEPVFHLAICSFFNTSKILMHLSAEPPPVATIFDFYGAQSSPFTAAWCTFLNKGISILRLQMKNLLSFPPEAKYSPLLLNFKPQTSCLCCSYFLT